MLPTLLRHQLAAEYHSGSILIGLGDLQVASDNFTGDSFVMLQQIAGL